MADLPTGTSSSTVPLGNDSRFNPTPTTAGKIPYDTGTGYSETATAGTSTQVLHGGSTPTYAAVSLTADVSGTLPVGNLPTGTSSSTVPLGNDSRFPPTPTAAGKVVYDTGTGYSETAAGTTSQVLVGGSAPAFGSVPAAAIPSTTVSAASYPTSGQVPTFTVGADGRLTAAGSTTTLTSPAISNPTYSGTEGGTRTIGGTPTLGVNLAAGGFKITGLGAPTAASSDAATATYAEAQKTGAGGPVFILNTSQSWGLNSYLGIANDGSSSINVNIVPWVAPAAGTLKNLRVQGLTNSNANLNITIYKASSAASPTYSATALVAAVANGSSAGNDTTHTVSVSAGDLIVAFSSAFWGANGLCCTCQFIPT